MRWLQGWLQLQRWWQGWRMDATWGGGAAGGVALLEQLGSGCSLEATCGAFIAGAGRHMTTVAVVSLSHVQVLHTCCCPSFKQSCFEPASKPPIAMCQLWRLYCYLRRGAIGRCVPVAVVAVCQQGCIMQVPHCRSYANSGGCTAVLLYRCCSPAVGLLLRARLSWGCKLSGVSACKG